MIQVARQSAQSPSIWDQATRWMARHPITTTKAILFLLGMIFYGGQAAYDRLLALENGSTPVVAVRAAAAQPAVAQVGSLKVTNFYTVPEDTHTAGMAGTTALPVPMKHFAPGTVDMEYFLSYTGAEPKVSAYQIFLYSPSGTSIHGSVHTLTAKNGNFAYYVYDAPQFPVGVYKMTVLLNGKVAGSTSFFIGWPSEDVRVSSSSDLLQGLSPIWADVQRQ
jgi:hypothetical protein